MVENSHAVASPTATRHFLAMGAHAQVVVVGTGAAELAERAEERLNQLERRWSRFLPDSDLSRVNRSGHVPVTVTRETFDLLRLAITAWEVTDGRFDPSILPALVAAGYDRSFHLLGAGDTRLRRDETPTRSPGCTDVELDPSARSVLTPSDLQLDLGGVGKGRGADLVATELLMAGAEGALVDLGGDIRVVGGGPGDRRWTVGIEHPHDGSLITTLALNDAGIATSSTAIHRWGAPDARAHHLIDPATGRPAESDVVAVTVIAADCAWAEVIAKSALIAGRDSGPELVRRFGLTGLFVLTDGTVWTLPELEDHVL